MRDARVHLMPYTHPHPEVCVAERGDAVGRPARRQVRPRHALRRRGRIGRLQRARHELGRRQRDRGRERSHHGPQRLRIVLNMHLADSRAGQGEHPLRYRGVRRLLQQQHAAAARARGRRPRRLGDRAQGRGGRHGRRRDRTHRAGATRSRASSAACSSRRTTGHRGRRRNARTSSTRAT